MDKRIILAVAGSGKTTYLVNQIDLTRRFLIVTYTNNNVNNIRTAIVKRFGYFPPNIKLRSYFQFLISVCFNPFLKDKCKAKGISFQSPPDVTNYLKRDNRYFYMTTRGCLYYNRIGLLCQLVPNVTQLISERIDKYFDCFFFDEIQDLAGHDFDLMLKIIPKNTQTIFVGDFYQHTFDTSRDGNQNKTLHDDINKYCKKWVNVGLQIDNTTLSNSWRCTQTTCDFVRNNLHIPIYSQNKTNSEIHYVENQESVDSLIQQRVPMLFFQDRAKYSCRGMNWGESKGLDDFDDVGIVLNKTTLDAYKKNNLSCLAPGTRNKFYVACTRAKGDIYFIPYNFLEKYKQK